MVRVSCIKCKALHTVTTTRPESVPPDSCVASLQHSVSVERGSHSVRAHPRNTPRQLTSPCTLYAPSTQPRQQIRALQATGAQDIVAERTPQRPTCRRAQQATWGRSSTRLQVRQTSCVGYLHDTRHDTVRHTYVGRDVRHTFVRAAGAALVPTRRHLCRASDARRPGACTVPASYALTQKQ